MPVVVATAATVIVLVGTLLWMHQTDASNAGHAYVPARLQDGRIVPGHAGVPQAQP